MADLLPEMSPAIQALVRASYGVLLFLTLAWVWPHRRRYFLSDRWGGYAESQPSVDWIHNPVAAPLALLLWAACAIALAAGVYVIPAAVLNLLLCRFFFVQMRWKGVLRGMGAPGFMTYWLGAVVLALEYTSRHAPDLHRLALLVAQVDFALIMLSAGVYKWTAGYAQGHGMDLGMVNPEWGYWWRRFRRVRTDHVLFRVLNHMAWLTEVAAAVLMLIPIPQLRAAGGLAMSASFVFIWTQIRLGWLAEIVFVCGLLFVYPGHIVDGFIASWLTVAPSSVVEGPALLNAVLWTALWAYLILLPVAHAGLFYNFYGRARLPGPLQSALERYTNFFGIIIWRVFSADHLNFFVRIWHEPRGGGRRELVSWYGSLRALRYAQVAECIAVTTVFTTLKYFATNRALFESRLRRYANTVPCDGAHVLVFEYVSIQKTDTRFAYVPVMEFVVDLQAETIETRLLDPAFDPTAAASTSPVHEGSVPGSYAPAR